MFDQDCTKLDKLEQFEWSRKHEKSTATSSCRWIPHYDNWTLVYRLSDQRLWYVFPSCLESIQEISWIESIYCIWKSYTELALWIYRFLYGANRSSSIPREYGIFPRKCVSKDRGQNFVGSAIFVIGCIMKFLRQEHFLGILSVHCLL